MDQITCNTTMKGMSNYFECYCKTDYCNGATDGNPAAAAKTFVGLASAVAILMVGHAQGKNI
jgi:hypothetical protein